VRRLVDVSDDQSSGPQWPEWDGPEHDKQWFDMVFRKHAASIHRYFLRRCPASDAEDLAADVLTTAWRRRADIPEGAELAWMYRTAGYMLANYRRKGRPIAVGDMTDASGEGDPADLVIADMQVRAALAMLSPKDRRVLLLNAWEGLTGEDLAAVLGTTRGAADTALSRARAKLAKAWVSQE